MYLEKKTRKTTGIGNTPQTKTFQGNWYELTLAQLLKSNRFYPTKNGAEWRTTCPFHLGSNPTAFSVSLQTGVFNCFACAARGVLLDYEYSLQPPDLSLITQQLSIASDSFTAKNGKTVPNKAQKIRRTLAKRNQNLDYQKVSLWDYSQSQLAFGQNYLLSRGISLQTARRAKLGYHPTYRFITVSSAENSAASTNLQSPTLTKNTQNVQKMVATYNSSEAANHYSYTYHPAIIFPTSGPAGFVNLYARAALAGQRLHHIPSGQKGIFNFEAITNVCGEQPLILVEGCFDALAMMEAGYANVAAIIGVNLTHLDWLWPLVETGTGNERIILALDNDEPGQLAQSHLAQQLQHKLGTSPLILPPDIWRGYKDFSAFWTEYGQPHHIKIDWSAVIARCYHYDSSTHNIPSQSAA